MTDGPVARKVKQSLLRHLWYLSEPLVVMALFDNEVSNHAKEEMALALQAVPRAQGFAPRKPALPAHIIRNDNVTLRSFIGEKSWLSFNLLGNDGGWLGLPPDQWEANAEFQQMASTLRNMAVVNDAAERGVKDVQDYANAARGGDQRDNIVIVSGSHRVKLRSYLKNEMEENL